MENKELIYNKDFKKFCEDLTLWANTWVDEVNDVIIRHLEELFNDEAIRILVEKYANDVREYERMNNNYLYRAYQFDYEAKTARTKKLFNYSDSLYYLCYQRFIKA